MAKALKLVFLNEEGKRQTLTPKAAKENLDAETVKTVMDNITQLSIFKVQQLRKYATVDSAHYTETIVTPLFDNED